MNENDQLGYKDSLISTLKNELLNVRLSLMIIRASTIGLSACQSGHLEAEKALRRIDMVLTASMPPRFRRTEDDE